MVRVETYLYNSKSLDSIRRKFEEPRMNDFETVFRLILAAKRFPNAARNYKSEHERVLKPTLLKIHKTFVLMHEINSRAATKYDSANQGSEKMLEVVL